MGKHDRTIEEGTVEFYKAENEKLRKRAEHAEESCRQLREAVARCQKWANEIEANAREMEIEKDAKIATLQAKIIKLVNDYVV